MPDEKAAVFQRLAENWLESGGSGLSLRVTFVKDAAIKRRIRRCHAGKSS
jgi:hypothetical protein